MIRKGSRKDTNQILSLFLEWEKEQGNPIEGSLKINFRKIISSYLGKGDRVFFVEEQEKGLKGYVFGHLVKRFPNGIYEKAKLVEVYVTPKYRMHNIGKELLTTFLSWVKKRGVRNILIETRTHDKKAISFWKKNRFKETWKVMEKKI